MQPKPQLRIGYGVDVHQLAAGYPLWIGGIQLPSELGAVGHSDADVLIHAICDALLGALALRDIGYHFSDQDPQFKGIDSKILLTRVIDLVKGKGYAIVNIDATVILESPKVNPHIAQMQEVLAAILEIQTDEISIKATTHEKVDSFGEKRAIKAYAAALLYQI
ncbi:MAG: 2-C-methyl-D-erythritol 2,4-cyclodiphosphate synthase [Cryomorphaceae bacterium]|jgi:2-C-methyl-D-erythritol 2,4-cyclodiphosphate synthase|nr:2-C-methyl-D-erythritol 2,4-cyclodiphosphate synthase [Cryomorphaceae bacterium]